MSTLRTIGVVSLLAAVCTVNAAGARLAVRTTQSHDLILSVDPALHQRFGLAYPVTYVIEYGEGFTGHQASIRYDSTSGWTLLLEKDADDHFNGINAVRFDELTRTAYVSVAFAAWSDDIHLRIRARDGASIPIAFGGIARYYDNRDAAVVVSIDDWKDYTDAMFTQMAGILRSYQLPYTTAVITGETTDSTWAHIQAELDAGDAEAASHTRSHPRWPYTGVEQQVAGSRLDLLEHLTMPAQYRRGETEYVYSFLVPFGETSAEIESTVTHAGYLNSRVVGYQNGGYTPWDTSMARFRYDGTTMEMGEPWGSTDVSELNGAFDQRLMSGGIYHLLLHPYTLVPSGEIHSEFFSEHLSHISGRENVWYTTFGHLYVYRLMGDSTVGQTVWPKASPTITLDPSSQIADEGSTVSFACTATGSAPLAFQWQRGGTNVTGATASSLILSGVSRADSGASFRCIVSNTFGADTSAPAVLSVVPPGSGGGIVSDDFNATALDTSRWQIVDPLHDGSIGVEGGGTSDAHLVIALPAGTPHDLWDGSLTAPRVMQPAADSDLSIAAKFEAVMNTPVQTQGMIVEQDSMHFIRFDLVYDASELVFFVATVSGGVPTERAAVTVPLQPPYHLRVRRTGDTWTGMYSSDGTSWITAASLTHRMHVRRVGLWAGNAGGTPPPFTARIDYFMNSTSPIADEDGIDVRTAPAITSDPATVTRFEGDSASFMVVATGGAPLAYRWQRNGVDIPGATSDVLMLSALVRADSGTSIRCIVSNGLGRDTSTSALLCVLPLYPAAITQEPEDSTVYAGSPATFRVAVSGTMPVSFRWQRDGNDIPGATDSLLAIAAAARADSGARFRCIVSNPGGVDTSRSALLSVLKVDTAMVITDPSDTTACIGSMVLFHISATGTAPLVYQWQQDGTDLPGAVDSLLTIPAVAPADSGVAFRCIVTNRGGSDTSAAAILHVIPRPTPAAFIRLSVHVFLEGAMSGDSMRTDLRDNGLLPNTQPYGSPGLMGGADDSVTSVPSAAVDWLLVELREGMADSTVRARRAGLVLRNGAVTEADGISPLRFEGISAGSYYIVVRHRNHLTAMSASALAMDSVAVVYDFRSAASQSYGGDAVLLSCGKFGMIGGNVDGNRGIGATDLARVRQAMTTGPAYREADCTMDGTVNASDLALSRGNIGRFSPIP